MENPYAAMHQQFASKAPSMPNLPRPPVMHQPQHQPQNHGDDKDDKKDKTKRLGQACGACRKRKVKCSGDKPVCTNCLRLNSPCVYAPSIKGKAPRSGYNEMLQKRLDKMEKLLQPLKQEGFTEEIWKSLTVPAEGETDLLSDGEHHTPPQHSPIARGTKRTADGETKAWDEPDTFPHGKVLSPPAAMPFEARPDDTDDEDDDERKPRIPLPPLHIQEHLAETYFSNCYVPYIVLHKPSFMKQLADATAAPALVLAVCAVSARFSRHPEVRQHPMAQAGDEYAAKSRQLLSLEFDRPTLSNVQAFLILGLHEFGSSRGARAWMYAGIAIRMAISLGLNVEDESKLSSQTWMECEIRRRVFWAAFIMDRFSSSSSAQAPHFLREKDVQIQLPSSDFEFLNEIPAATEMLNGGYHPAIMKVPGIQIGALDPTAYFIRMISTWGRVISYVNGPRDHSLPPWDPKSDFARLDNELYGMHSSLPQLYIYTRNNLSAAIAENRAHALIFLHITIRHSLYFLHRWIFPSKITPQVQAMYKDAPPDFINTSARKCIASANAISLILAHVQEMNTLLLVPFMGFCAYTTATLHVSNAFSPDAELSRTAKRHLATNLRILTLMRKHWTVTERWCQAVRELYELQQNSATDRRGNFVQNAITSAVTYGTFKDDIPNKYDKQQFLYSTAGGIGSNSSQHSGSPSVRAGRQPSQSPAAMFGEIIQTPKSNYQVEEKPSLLYPPTAEITPEARRKVEEERAVLEAMAQSAASLPVTPYFGPMMFQNNMPFSLRDPENESFQFGTQIPIGMNWGQMDNNGVNMEDFPSLDEIISSMEGMVGAGNAGGYGEMGGGQTLDGMDGGGGLNDGFGFLDDLGLFDATMI